MTSGIESGYVNSRLITASGDHNVYPSAPGASKTNFTINLGTNVQKVSKVSFTTVAFRNNAYNVNSTGNGKNNTFAVTVNGVTVEMKVDAGWYTTSTLMAAVQALVQAELTAAGDGQTFTLAQDTLTNKVSATYTQGASVNPDMTIERATDAQGAEESGVWELLGFNVTSPITLEDAIANVATYLPSLGGLSEVFLQSRALSPGHTFDVNGQQRNYSLAIPVTAVFGALNVWDCKVDKLCEITYASPRNLQLVDFSLVDKDGELIDLHGANLVVNLRAYFNSF